MEADSRSRQGDSRAVLEFVEIDRDDGGGGERSYMHTLTCRIAITDEHVHGRSRDIWRQLRTSQEPE